MSTSAVMAPEIESVLNDFRSDSGLDEASFEVKRRSDGDLLVLHMAHPSERFYTVLERARARHGSPAATIIRRAPANRLLSPEARYFLRTLTESLNINRNSFREDFFARYTKSVSNAEGQITAKANHVVFGRRGAGKSSLLLYAMRTRERDRRVSAWADLQAYQTAREGEIVVGLLAAVLEQVGGEGGVAVPGYAPAMGEIERLRRSAGAEDVNVTNGLVLDARRALEELVRQRGDIFVFLDDFHVLNAALQPRVLGRLYEVTRGLEVYLKLSAIESLTRTWDGKEKRGLQVPHDAQAIKLDLNLTMPDKALRHIEGILDAHARYCGLESVGYLCTSSDVMTRLLWVSAGVPRDAISNFAQAMTRGITEDRSKVSVTNVNLSASDLVSEKQKDLGSDVTSPQTQNKLATVLEYIREICVEQVRKNAFLVEIRSHDAGYLAVQELVDLRLLHVVSEGISVGQAGKKYQALILDYGFYTGIRKAQTMELFNARAEHVRYKELRKLPRVNPAEALKLTACGL